MAELKSLYGALNRCYNPNCKDYPYYGGRGIKVCDRWRFGENGLTKGQCFLQDMGKKPAPEYSIDRIDSNGDYEPGNCRWATPQEQTTNRRLKTGAGVYFRSDRSKWVAVIERNKKRTYLGVFKTEAEAVAARRAAEQ